MMRNLTVGLAKIHKVMISLGMSQVCKTFIHRFDSDPRLHPTPSQNQQLTAHISCFSTTFEGLTKPSKTAKVRRSASGSLTASLTESLTGWRAA